MPASPFPGKLYLNPASAGVGGTPIEGILDDEISFDPSRPTEAHGSGLDPDSWSAVEVPGDEPPALVIPVRDVSAETLSMLLAAISQGTALHSSGGQAVESFDSARSSALVLRPRSGTQLLYGPRWARHPRCQASIVWHRTKLRFEGSTLILMPQPSLDGTKRAYMEDTAANINAHYGL
jgi:hypothetical protein